MEIIDSFRVSTPLEDTWRVLLDIEGIAPCLPGAQLQEIEGDEYRGIVKVKVGPITAQYKGTATLTEVDESRHRIVINASGRDTRGQGNASAAIVVAMVDDGSGTVVEVVTDLSITGKVAQFGRGVLGDVSAKLLRQFVENLERDVLADAGGVDVGGGVHKQGAREEDVSEEATREERGDVPVPAAGAPDRAPTSNGPASGPPDAAAGSGPRQVESREVEPIDLLDVAGESAARRLAPLVAALAALFLIWRLLRRRS